jgi:predicted HicB family RNase H-like nuclease
MNKPRKYTLRMPKSLYLRLIAVAKSEGLSLQQWIIENLVISEVGCERANLENYVGLP